MPGIHSTVQSLHTRLLHRWVPKWYGAFSDPRGGFYERLGKGFKPVLTGQRRLVTQCRQLAIYSHASTFNNNKKYKNLKAQFEFILTHYHDPQTGLWHFSLEDNLAVANRTCDLYALSFVIFSFSHYFRATQDVRARDAARDVLTLIDARFRVPDLPGLAEAIDGRYRPVQDVRRQNPHMHLFEACIFAFEVWQDPAFAAMAREMASLFDDYFYDAETHALTEFFSHALHPHFEKGSRLEPGHYFEWVWLLKSWQRLSGERPGDDAVCADLLDWANTHGWDKEFGGIFDCVSVDGRVLEDTKRIWPFCEALKANALMLDSGADRQRIKDRVADMVELFNRRYMEQRGFWTEWLARDFTPVTDYMPGTTPYHVYFGITETLAALDLRGGQRSFGAGADTRLYGLRRWMSAVARAFLRFFRR